MHATPSHRRAHRRLALTTLGIYERACVRVCVCARQNAADAKNERETNARASTASTQTLRWCQNWISLAGFPIGVFAF